MLLLRIFGLLTSSFVIIMFHPICLLTFFSLKTKCCDFNKKDDLNSPNILSNNNYQASSQKIRQEVSWLRAAVLKGAASRICSKQHAASLCSFYLAFLLLFCSPVNCIFVEK